MIPTICHLSTAPQSGINIKPKKLWPFKKYLNKKEQANLYLADAQEIHQLESFSQSHITQSFIPKDPVDSDSNGGEPFFICQI